MEHTFVIPAYGRAAHLEGLLHSLQAQTQTGSRIILTTSTPSPFLEDVAQRFGIALSVNPLRIDIGTDWNFALDAATTPLVTIAHQDDRYEPGYLAALSAALGRHSRAVLAFCDYREHTPQGARPENLNLRIKRLLCRRGFGRSDTLSTPREKIRLLSLGNPICCPTVMLNRALLPQFRFAGGLQTNLDWMAWLTLARREGDFVYVREQLISKGVHAASETTATIASRARSREDRLLFDQFWPWPVAPALAAIYRFGYRANRVEELKPDQD
jgi:hypothetical protein